MLKGALCRSGECVLLLNVNEVIIQTYKYYTKLQSASLTLFVNGNTGTYVS